jgi:hypothetical protein
MFPFSKVGLQFYWVNTIVSADYYAKNKEIADNVQSGIAEGMKFMLLNPTEAMERHMKEHEELALGKSGKLYVELGMGMTRAIMMAPESIEHGVGYTDLGKINEQAKVVEDYTMKPGEHAPPPADKFVSNVDPGKFMLTRSQWDEVKSSTQQYAKLLGQI